jgi:putative membrane protein
MKQTLAKENAIPVALFLSLVLIWIFFYFNCIDIQDWFIENIIVFMTLMLLFVTKRFFSFSVAAYFCIFLFIIIHLFGAQYAYTQNPVGEWFQQKYQLTRNPYDRVVHFSFGFFLVIPLMELLHKKFKTPEKYLNIMVLNIILGLACVFELIEWMVSVFTTKETGETYVATQGDVWDAQKDIVLAVVGAFIVIGFRKLTPILLKRKKMIPIGT